MKSPIRYPLRFFVVGLGLATAGFAHAQPAPPTVITLPASAVGVTIASLNGSGNPWGAPTFAGFEWGMTTNYGNLTSLPAIGSAVGSTNFSQTVGGLVGGVTYHFRALASNSVSIARGANQSFTTVGPAVSGPISVRRTTNGPVELTFGGIASPYLIEASTNLSHWKLIGCLNASGSPVRFLDPEPGQFAQRFYRYRTFLTSPQTLFYFPDYVINAEALFRIPSFSSTTTNFLDRTPGNPNFVRVTNTFPGGGPAGNVLQVSWVFTNGAVNPWLRLTTFNGDGFPNPALDLSQGFGFDIHTDRDLYVVLGLREITTNALVGADGGVTGPIEWVGGTADNSGGPPRGRLITAGQWQSVLFWLPDEPVRGFTGDHLLSSPTGKGVFEHLALVPATGTGPHTIYLGNFQTVQRVP